MVGPGPKMIRSGSPRVPSGENFQAYQSLIVRIQATNARSILFSFCLMAIVTISRLYQFVVNVYSVPGFTVVEEIADI